MFFNKRVMRGRQGGTVLQLFVVFVVLLCCLLLSFVVFWYWWDTSWSPVSPVYLATQHSQYVVLIYPRNVHITGSPAPLQGIAVLCWGDKQKRGSFQSDQKMDDVFFGHFGSLRRQSSIYIDRSNRLNNCQTRNPELDTMMQNRLFVLQQWINLPFGNHFQ